MRNFYKKNFIFVFRSPISLEDIANVNRKRHEENNGNNYRYQIGNDACGALELEAIATVHELACSVQSISGSFFKTIKKKI